MFKNGKPKTIYFFGQVDQISVKTEMENTQSKSLFSQIEIDSDKENVPKIVRKRPCKNKNCGASKKHKSCTTASSASCALSSGEEAIKRIQMKRVIKLRKAEELIQRTFISGCEKRLKIYEKLLKEL